MKRTKYITYLFYVCYTDYFLLVLLSRKIHFYYPLTAEAFPLWGL